MNSTNTLTLLVTARSAAARENEIAKRIDPTVSTAVLAEGLSDGIDTFHRFTDNSLIQVARIAPGCPCCIGNLTMRVTLNRLLRNHPRHLYLALAPTSHLQQIISWLTLPPYDELLTLTEVIDIDHHN